MQPVCLHMIFYSLQLFTHNLIKDKRIDLIEITFNREGFPYLACNDRIAFLLLKKNIMHGLVKMYMMRWPFYWTTYFIRFGNKLYRQVVGISMGIK